MIRTCICGSPAFVRYRRGIPQLEVLDCSRCHTERLAADLLPDGVLETYSSGSYHQSTERHANVVPYAQRLEHDKHVGDLRMARYRDVLGSLEGMSLLDVGAGNGGFLRAAQRVCFASGIDPDPQGEGVAKGTIATLKESHYDVITYHDVLEHVFDPAAELRAAVRHLGVRGHLIVDVPDVFVPNGLHHYKHEHIWYFSLRGLVDLLRVEHLDIVGVDFPIAGKLVVYGQRIR